MKQANDPQYRARAEQVYDWLLRLYPAAHRRAFAEPMLQTFHDHYHDAIETRDESEVRFWLGVVGDEGRSLLREHFATLRERKPSMKKRLHIALLVAGLLLLGSVLFVPRIGRFVFSLSPLPFLSLPAVLLLLVFFAPPLVMVASFLRTFPRSATRPTWLRLGLMMGVVLGGYHVALYVVNEVLPLFPQHQDTSIYDAASNVGSVGGTFLLVGTVGVLGGYTSGNQWLGACAGLLAGLIDIVVTPLSQVLVIALTWPALQHDTLQSALAMDYQSWLQRPTLHPLLGGFLTAEFFAHGVGVPLITSLTLLVVEGLFALLGSALDAAEARRAVTLASQLMQPATLPSLARRIPTRARFILGMLLLSLLMWSFFALANLFATDEFSWAYFGSTFTSQEFVAWLFVGLLIVVSGLVTVRPRSAQPRTFSAEPGL